MGSKSTCFDLKILSECVARSMESQESEMPSFVCMFVLANQQSTMF